MSEKAIVDAEARLTRQGVRLVRLLWLLESYMAEVDPQGVKIMSITVRPDKRAGVGVLVIVKGVYEGENLVGFSGGSSVDSALVSALESLRNKSMRYRTDTPFGAR